MSPLGDLKERKIVQWAFAYLAGAWVLAEVGSLVGDHFAWPGLWLRMLLVVLAIGFFVALILAWYHGEKGAQRVSTVELGMLTGVLVIAGVGVAWVQSPSAELGSTAAPPVAASALATAAAMAEQGSIAVLPFVNMSSDPEQEYFSDGITEELLNVLAQLPELRVAARTSAFAFKGKDIGIDSIGRALNVRHVLEGSVRKAGNQVRITAQLIDASSGYHLWSDTYDRELKDVFAVQDEIARAIVDQLEIRLSGGREHGQLARAQTGDPEAHQLYLRGRQVYMHGEGEPSNWLTTAERLYGQALARDSSYAAAWAGLADVHRLQAQFRLLPRLEGLEQATAEAERALALNPEEGDAHLGLGALQQTRGNSAAAGPHYERALLANPGDARTVGYYSSWLSAEGRHQEALRWARRAVELDPLSVSALTFAGRVLEGAGDLRGSAAMHERAFDLQPDDPMVLRRVSMTRVLLGQREEGIRAAERLLELVPDVASELLRIGFVHAYAGNFDRAVELFRRGVELEPDDPAALAYLANALVMVGESDEAVRLAGRAVELAPEHEHVRGIHGYVNAMAGRRAAAERSLEQIPENALILRAAIRANLGEKDRAFALLDRAVETKTSGVTDLGADWWFDPLRGDPRMERLLARLGVPDVVLRRSGQE